MSALSSITRRATTRNGEQRLSPGNWRTSRSTSPPSETHFSDEGSVDEVGAGYNFFYRGRPKAERREGAVAFITRTDIVGRLPGLAQDSNDRLMRLRLPLWGGKFATNFSVYALQ
ncbi:unnamed protein product [Dibothriocephalus latus]|uniref:Uncharacterized protein n=1 Tax=Dibothriocephalus latus TaxID=60516 RepID=A0A3P7QHH3_DIBLA|nr:unnamed protein product [Dibothriocephalus latus]